MSGSLVRSRWPAYCVGLGLVLLSALPAFGPAGRDGFPFSTYPMFTAKRDRPHVVFVEQLDEKGRARRLGPTALGTSEFMQAFATLSRSVNRGPEATEALCRSMAERLARREKKKRPVRLRVVRARFDPVAYFTDSAEPEERTVVASCTGRKP
jgi:hypothetical protein